VNDGIQIAVSKGRIFDEALPLLARAGIEPVEDPGRSRKLILETNRAGLRLVVIRAADVPTYVDYGAADLGITGKDVLLEYEGDGIYEPLDLNIARCRLMVAGPRDRTPPPRRIRVATKYLRTTEAHFAKRGVHVELIKLYGSMELAPLVGLADRIVDLVDTGNTLKANGLEPVEEICAISSRLIVNRASMKMKNRAIKALIDELAAQVER
jgi:ATP phosphoribosyltransferase